MDHGGSLKGPVQSATAMPSLPLIAAAAVSLAVLAVDTQLPLGVSGGVAQIAAVLVALWSPRRGDVLLVASAATLFTLVGALASPPGGPVWQVVANRLLAIGAVWIVATLGLLRLGSQAELLVSRIIYQSIVDGTLDGVITIDANGRVCSFNSAAGHIFGYQPEEVIGEDVAMLMPHPTRGEHDGYFERYLRTGDSVTIGVGRQVEGLRRDGSRFPLELSISEVRAGKQTMFARIVRDVNEREQTLEQLQLARETAEAGNRAKSAFLANMSHEIRTPLSAILGFSELLLDPGQTASEREAHFEVIRRNGARLLRFADDILDLTGADADRLSIEQSSFSLSDLAEAVVGQARELAASKGLRLSVELDGPIPETVWSDETRVR